VTGGNGLQIDVELLNAGYRYALSLCANQHDAEDLTHDAWISVVTKYGSEIETKLLLSTIRNRFIDQYRRHRNWQAIVRELLTTVDLRKPDVHDGFDAFREIDLEPHLAMLRAVEREALFLQLVEGYTATEIAELTSTRRGTVVSRVSRARAKLRKSIASRRRGIAGSVRLGSATADSSG